MVGMQHADIWFSDDSFNDIHLCRGYLASCLPRVRSTCHCLAIMSNHLSQLSKMQMKRGDTLVRLKRANQKARVLGG